MMGTLDPDWASPRAEGSAIVAALPSGSGRLEMIEGAGHYPHVQVPDQVVSLLLGFLAAARPRLSTKEPDPRPQPW
jgi:pimeloyl-ACP methyl ester carboxylesterase